MRLLAGAERTCSEPDAGVDAADARPRATAEAGGAGEAVGARRAERRDVSGCEGDSRFSRERGAAGREVTERIIHLERTAPDQRPPVRQSSPQSREACVCGGALSLSTQIVQIVPSAI